MVGESVPLAERRLTYPTEVGTDPAGASWSVQQPGFRTNESTAHIGSGNQYWLDASLALMSWAVKTRSGFDVAGRHGPLALGDRYWVTAQVGPVRVREPVEIVAVVETPTRIGFAYGTLQGHPVSGEEAFIVHRTPDGAVFLTLRSLTGPSTSQPWWLLFPVLLGVQRIYRRRYLRALIDLPEGNG